MQQPSLVDLGLPPTPSPLLELRGISRRFGALLANDSISLSLGKGEILGLLGENGAGKSTLMNILAGIVPADQGQIFVRGRPIAIESPAIAASAGIGMVHQHFKLVGSMTVAENLALGDRGKRKALENFSALERDLAQLSSGLGLSVDLARRVDELSVGGQQQVEIIRALSRSPDILILDEPTAVLAPEERRALFQLLSRLRQRGIGIILISHRLDDIFECCDRVVVLRRGRVEGTGFVRDLTRDQLVRLIVGGEIAPTSKRPLTSTQPRPVVEVKQLRLLSDCGHEAVVNASFELFAGEIAALCGVEGNGQSELIQGLAGMRPPAGGRLRYWLRSTLIEGPVSAGRLRQFGVGHIPEDRLRYAVLPNQSLRDNWLMTFLWRGGLSRRGWLALDEAGTQCNAAVQYYAIKAPDIHTPMRQLSGGNQQKLVLARELAHRPDLLLAAHPARGLDARTTAFVHEALLRLRDRGAAVLLLTADLDEAWLLADRIMVMSAGRIHGPSPMAEISREKIGAWMTVHA